MSCLPACIFSEVPYTTTYQHPVPALRRGGVFSFCLFYRGQKNFFKKFFKRLHGKEQLFAVCALLVKGR